MTPVDLLEEQAKGGANDAVLTKGGNTMQKKTLYLAGEDHGRSVLPLKIL